MSTSHAVQRVHTPRVRVRAETIAVAIVAATAIALLVLAIVNSGSTVRLSTHSLSMLGSKAQPATAPAIASPAQSVPSGYVRNPATHQLLKVTVPAATDPDVFGGMR